MSTDRDSNPYSQGHAQNGEEEHQAECPRAPVVVINGSGHGGEGANTKAGGKAHRDPECRRPGNQETDAQKTDDHKEIMANRAHLEKFLLGRLVVDKVAAPGQVIEKASHRVKRCRGLLLQKDTGGEGLFSDARLSTRVPGAHPAWGPAKPECQLVASGPVLASLWPMTQATTRSELSNAAP